MPGGALQPVSHGAVTGRPASAYRGWATRGGIMSDDTTWGYADTAWG